MLDMHQISTRRTGAADWIGADGLQSGRTQTDQTVAARADETSETVTAAALATGPVERHEAVESAALAVTTAAAALEIGPGYLARVALALEAGRTPEARDVVAGLALTVGGIALAEAVTSRLKIGPIWTGLLFAGVSVAAIAIRARLTRARAQRSRRE